MNQEKIGKFIAENRKKNSLTQEQLAEKLHVSKNAVSKWERGLNLPDASIMNELCNRINISLNELFAGEYIDNKDLKSKSENNLLILFKFGIDKKRINKILTVFVLIISFVLINLTCRFILIKKGYIPEPNLVYTQRYEYGKDNLQGSVDYNKYEKISMDFEIGANKYGYAVFKNPNKAFKRLKKNYSKGLKLIQNEYKLFSINNFNFREYKTYGWQLTTGSEEEIAQAIFITSFLDIYENSFN